MIDNETLNKIIEKKTLWAEIEAQKREYSRLQSQIRDVEQAMTYISIEVQKKLHEFQEIGEWLSEREQESLLRYKK
jgi:hypothetical protein